MRLSVFSEGSESSFLSPLLDVKWSSAHLEAAKEKRTASEDSGECVWVTEQGKETQLHCTFGLRTVDTFVAVARVGRMEQRVSLPPDNLCCVRDLLQKSPERSIPTSHCTTSFPVSCLRGKDHYHHKHPESNSLRVIGSGHTATKSLQQKEISLFGGILPQNPSCLTCEQSVTQHL